MKLNRALVGVTLLATTALAACGQANEDSGKPAAKNGKDLVVGISNLGVSFPFPASIAEGMKARAKELGVKIVEADAKGDAERQSTDVQDLISQSPDGILLMPVDSAVATGIVDSLESSKIPVVAVASQVGDPKTRDLEDVYSGLVALVTQRELDAGGAAGALALEAEPDGGKIAIIEGAPGFAEIETRSAKFFDAAKEAGVEFEVVARQSGEWTAEGAESACQTVLSTQPDIELIYAQSDDMAAGCAQAIKSAGSKVKLIGIGGSKLGIDGIKAGEIYGTVCYKPYDLGVLAMDTLYANLTGEDTETAKFVSYDTPAINAKNIADCDPQW